MMHGTLETLGWLLAEGNSGEKKSIAYLTDCNYISDESIELIHKNAGKLVHLVIDGLRIKEHSTHFSFLQALEMAGKIGAENVWFTHLTHNSSHVETAAYMEEHRKEFPGLEAVKTLQPAYDGLVIEC
jgi:phosphoribosyl 1,2-cyclic phosphate phosphodiesterase